MSEYQYWEFQKVAGRLTAFQTRLKALVDSSVKPTSTLYKWLVSAGLVK